MFAKVMFSQVFVHSQGDRRYGYVGAVRILLECILVVLVCHFFKVSKFDGITHFGSLDLLLF